MEARPKPTKLKSLRYARILRHDSTDAEKRLWGELRNRRVAGMKFRRQAPVGHFIADFCCEERKLIIELDGGQHDGSSYDERRDKWLGDHGYRVLRIWNNDVLENTEGVLELILMKLTEVQEGNG